MTETIERAEIKVLAIARPAGVKVFEVPHHAPAQNLDVRVGHKPFTYMTRLRAYEVTDGETLIGQLFSIPVQSKNGTISLDYSARYVRPDWPNSTYLGGFKTREEAIVHILKLRNEA